MRRKISFASVLLLLCLMIFAGCTSKDELSGTSWKLTSAESNGVTITQQQYEQEAGGSWEIAFGTNGICNVTLAGQKAKNTYAIEGNTIVFTENGTKYTADYTPGSNTFVLHSQGISVTFTKQS